MTKLLVLSFFLTSVAQAYVPTVESLFRHGANPDVTQNAVSLSMVVKRGQTEAKADGVLNDVSLLRDQRQEDFYRIFFSRGNGEVLRLSQIRYANANFSDAALQHKVHFPNFSALTIRPGVEHLEKGVFYGMLISMALNNGSFMINYLKQLNVPVRANSEILNRQKVELLASYKQYLATINRDRNARKNEANPLRPDEREARERAEQIMNESMYADTRQVRLTRDSGDMAWLVTAGPFEAVVNYTDRSIRRITYKSPIGELELLASEYWLANGVHSMPRIVDVRSPSGETWQIEFKNLRHFTEKEDELVKRINHWDQLLKGKEASDPRPEFLL
jgi:hypothetical protein